MKKVKITIEAELKVPDGIIFVDESLEDDDDDSFPHFKHKDYPDVKIEPGMQFLLDGEIPGEKWGEIDMSLMCNMLESLSYDNLEEEEKSDKEITLPDLSEITLNAPPVEIPWKQEEIKSKSVKDILEDDSLLNFNLDWATDIRQSGRGGTYLNIMFANSIIQADSIEECIQNENYLEATAKTKDCKMSLDILESCMELITSETDTFFSNTIQQYEFTQTLHDLLDIIIDKKIDVPFSKKDFKQLVKWKESLSGACLILAMASVNEHWGVPSKTKKPKFKGATSMFYNWLCDQIERDDEIGSLAAHVVLDSNWPKKESSKEVLRSYLRNNNLKHFVKDLSVAIKEFGRDTAVEVPDETIESSLSLIEPKLASTLLVSWWESGCPDRGKVELLAEENDPIGLALLGLQMILGIETDSNVNEGIKYLEESFESGFLPAAEMLGELSSVSMDFENSRDWFLKGAAEGDEACLKKVLVNQAIYELMPGLPNTLNIEKEKLDHLDDKGIRETGEIEWHLGTSLERMGRLKDALSHYDAAIKMGFSKAYSDKASAMKDLGRESEAEELYHQGAEAGDYLAKGILAVMHLKPVLANEAELPDEELTSYITDLENAAEHAVESTLLPMAEIYFKGIGVEKNAEKAKVLLLVAATTEKDSEDDAKKILGEYFPGEKNHEVKEVFTWLCESASKHQTQSILNCASSMWLELKMERPN